MEVHLEDLVRVCAHERRAAVQDLIQHHAESVVIHCEAVALVLYDLWGHVLGSPAEGVGPLPRLELLDEAEISHLKEPFVVEQDVLRFQVSVDQAFRMEILEAEDDLSGVKLGMGERDLPELVDDSH